MKKSLIAFVLASVTLLSLVVTDPVIQTSATQLNVPKEHKVSGSFETQENNKLFFSVPSGIAPLTNLDFPNGARMNYDIANSYFESIHPVSDSQNGVLPVPYIASNLSSSPLLVNYNLGYYDLSDVAKNNRTVENMPFRSGASYSIQVNFTQQELYTFSLSFSSRTANMSVTFTLVDPSGFSSYNSFTMRSDIVNFVPILPLDSGMYVVIVEFANSGVLNSFEILRDIKLIDIEDGITESVTGKSSTLKFFRMKVNDSTPKVGYLRSTVFSNYLRSYDYGSSFKGEIILQYFNLYSGIFGLTFTDSSTEILVSSSNEVIVAVIVLPPNDDDPIISAEKKQMGLEYGFSFEYAFWLELEDIPEFSFNTNLPVERGYYYLTVEDTMGLNVNSTGDFYSIVYNMEKNERLFFNTINHDVFSPITGVLFTLDAGVYVFYIYGQFTDPSSFFQITPIPITPLLVDRPVIKEFDLYRPQIFSLSTNSGLKEFFNFTYMDFNNASVEFSFKFFNNRGFLRSLTQFNFSRIASPTDRNYFSVNNTVVGSNSPYDLNNPNRGYLLVTMISNKEFNSSVNVPTVLRKDNVNFTANLRIERKDAYSVLQRADPDIDNSYNALTSRYTKELNYSKSQITTYLRTSLSTGIYKISMRSENVSFNWKTIFDFDTNTFGDTVQRIQGNKTEYIDEIYIPVSERKTFLILVFFDLTADGNVNDGLFEITLEKQVLQTISGANLGELLTTKYTESSNKDITLITINEPKSEDTAPSGIDLNTALLVGGGVAGIGAVSGIVIYLLKKRK